MKRLKQHLLFLLFVSILSIQGIFFLGISGIFPLSSLGFPEEFSSGLGSIVLLWVSMGGLGFFYFFVQRTYIRPILLLRTEIAYFLAGVQSPKRLETKNLNPDLSYVGSFFHRSLEILKNFKEEFQSGRVLRSEVELAADIQKHVLKKNHPTIPSLEIVADTKSASEVGGDSYDIITQGDNVYIYIGDVTGHGVASGFVMMVVNALISGFSKMMENSAEILVRTNEILKPRVKSNMLMTLLMIRWNERDKKLYMVGAGHEYLLLYKKWTNKVHAIKSGGVALGMTRDISKILKEVQLSFEPGDCIILYTDGITEARNGNKESDLMFGVERLVEVIANTPKKTALGIFKHVTIELSKFMGYKSRQFDDISLIVVRYKVPDELPNIDIREISQENITEWNWH